MQTNPSRTFGYVEAQTELPIVQIVPESSSHEFPVDALKALEGSGDVGIPEHLILM